MYLMSNRADAPDVRGVGKVVRRTSRTARAHNADLK
jgi:hypothetical protein